MGGESKTIEDLESLIEGLNKRVGTLETEDKSARLLAEVESLRQQLTSMHGVKENLDELQRKLNVVAQNVDALKRTRQEEKDAQEKLLFAVKSHVDSANKANAEDISRLTEAHARMEECVGTLMLEVDSVAAENKTQTKFLRKNDTANAKLDARMRKQEAITGALYRQGAVTATASAMPWWKIILTTGSLLLTAGLAILIAAYAETWKIPSVLAAVLPITVGLGFFVVINGVKTNKAQVKAAKAATKFVGTLASTGRDLMNTLDEERIVEMLEEETKRVTDSLEETD